MTNWNRRHSDLGTEDCRRRLLGVVVNADQTFQNGYFCDNHEQGFFRHIPHPTRRPCGLPVGDGLCALPGSGPGPKRPYDIESLSMTTITIDDPGAP